MAWSAPRTWVAGETVTAAIMNTHVRDNLLAATTWQDYTPAWTASGTAPTLGNATLVGRYISAGRLFHVRLRFVYGSTSSPGTGTWRFSLPFTIASNPFPSFAGKILDTGTTHYPAVGVPNTTTTFEIFETTVANTGIGANTPIVWATGDEILITGSGELP